MIEKNKRWVEKRYTNWVATLPCASCGLDDETTVAHHLKHRHSPHGGGGIGMKANDFLTMPLCFSCHDRAHNGDADVLDWQADHIFKTLTTAFNSGIIGYVGEGSVLELFLQKGTLPNQPGRSKDWKKVKLFGEDLDD
tara:strand:+ start:266 stop:679 length:414 start_codon:yes stop_codon:yes gene_type:complete